MMDSESLAKEVTEQREKSLPASNFTQTHAPVDDFPAVYPEDDTEERKSWREWNVEHWHPSFSMAKIALRSDTRELYQNSIPPYKLRIYFLLPTIYGGMLAPRIRVV
jgi:hypothetical protein